MADIIRLRCPFCGSMPYPKQLENAEGKPAEVRIILMSILGKTPAEPDEDYKKKGKGKGGHGSIIYKDVTDEHPELVEQYKKWFAERAVKFAEQAGFINTAEG